MLCIGLQVQNRSICQSSFNVEIRDKQSKPKTGLFNYAGRIEEILTQKLAAGPNPVKKTRFKKNNLFLVFTFSLIKHIL